MHYIIILKKINSILENAKNNYLYKFKRGHYNRVQSRRAVHKVYSTLGGDRNWVLWFWLGLYHACKCVVVFFWLDERALYGVRKKTSASYWPRETMFNCDWILVIWTIQRIAWLRPFLKLNFDRLFMKVLNHWEY